MSCYFYAVSHFIPPPVCLVKLNDNPHNHEKYKCHLVSVLRKVSGARDNRCACHIRESLASSARGVHSCEIILDLRDAEHFASVSA